MKCTQKVKQKFNNFEFGKIPDSFIFYMIFEIVFLHNTIMYYKIVKKFLINNINYSLKKFKKLLNFVFINNIILL